MPSGLNKDKKTGKFATAPKVPVRTPTAAGDIPKNGPEQINRGQTPQEKANTVEEVYAAFQAKLEQEIVTGVTKTKLEPDLYVNVKTAAGLTSSSIPRFYSDKNKEMLGYPYDGSGPFLISVNQLITIGFLGANGEVPTSRPARRFGVKGQNKPKYSNVEYQFALVENKKREFARLDDLQVENARLRKELISVQEELSVLREERRIDTKVLISAIEKILAPK